MYIASKQTGAALIGASIIVLAFLISPLYADESKPVSLQTKTVLQAHLKSFLTQASSEDGGFEYVDRTTSRRRTAYLSSHHPQIIPFEGDYYLCVSMIDDTGTLIDVDFLMRPRAGISIPQTPQDVLIVDIVIDNRALLLDAVQNSKRLLP